MSLQYGLIIVYIMNKKVVFFDSGIGGLSTLAVALSLCPTLSYIYVADNKHAPYGRLPARTVTKYVWYAGSSGSYATHVTGDIILGYEKY